MFTDIVGYTALTQEDESSTMQMLEDHRRLLRPYFTSHGGREVKTIGDAFLVEFGSALDAVLCAIAIQNMMHDRKVARGGMLSLRIGVHVGDVIESGNDILGDAVNIASRIQPLAEPGGVCISGPVYEQVKNKLQYSLDKIATPHLKNVREPVDVYKIVMPWSVEQPAPSIQLDEETHRRLAIHQHEFQSRRGILRRRHDGGADHIAFRGEAADSHRKNIRDGLQGDDEEGEGDWKRA